MKNDLSVKLKSPTSLSIIPEKSPQMQGENPSVLNVFTTKNVQVHNKYGHFWNIIENDKLAYKRSARGAAIGTYPKIVYGPPVERLTSRNYKKLKKTIKRELGKDAKLEYHIVLENSSGSKPYVSKIPSINQKKIDNMPVNMPININKTVIRNPFIIPGLKKINIESNLNPAYNFDNFVEGDCNRLARASGFAVSNKPGGTAFNPLLIYGGVGLGKTHLLNAICIELEKKTNVMMKILKQRGIKLFIHQPYYSLINRWIEKS